eukprot:TRINITY_DN967_c0_g1_i1.p1 TRINITY_DN967_c0_g1~~TRINITY_DN967_c0_g1_i1.p1  ORF type:complete len:347 (+),score=51.81 TRINITY_DN967_c0_g1_i1:452-1492(+)
MCDIEGFIDVSSVRYMKIVVQLSNDDTFFQSLRDNLRLYQNLEVLIIANNSCFSDFVLQEELVYLELPHLLHLELKNVMLDFSFRFKFPSLENLCLTWNEHCPISLKKYPQSLRKLQISCQRIDVEEKLDLQQLEFLNCGIWDSASTLYLLSQIGPNLKVLKSRFYTEKIEERFPNVTHFYWTVKHSLPTFKHLEYLETSLRNCVLNMNGSLDNITLKLHDIIDDSDISETTKAFLGISFEEQSVYESHSTKVIWPYSMSLLYEIQQSANNIKRYNWVMNKIDEAITNCKKKPFSISHSCGSQLIEWIAARELCKDNFHADMSVPCFFNAYNVLLRALNQKYYLES